MLLDDRLDFRLGQVPRDGNLTTGRYLLHIGTRRPYARIRKLVCLTGGVRYIQFHQPLSDQRGKDAGLALRGRPFEGVAVEGVEGRGVAGEGEGEEVEVDANPGLATGAAAD
jgi:hypothetical protein